MLDYLESLGSMEKVGSAVYARLAKDLHDSSIKAYLVEIAKGKKKNSDFLSSMKVLALKEQDTEALGEELGDLKKQLAEVIEKVKSFKTIGEAEILQVHNGLLCLEDLFGRQYEGLSDMDFSRPIKHVFGHRAKDQLEHQKLLGVIKVNITKVKPNENYAAPSVKYKMQI